MVDKFGKCGFIKPVGQRHVLVENGLKVDKDVRLFKEHFKMDESYANMSPLVLPRGYTKDFIDGKISVTIDVAPCNTKIAKTIAKT